MRDFRKLTSALLTIKRLPVTGYSIARNKTIAYRAIEKTES
jgi:hypothetical protein